MSVEFDEQNNFGPAGSVTPQQIFNPESEASGLTGWLMKKGIAANETTANAIMLVISLCSVGLTIFVIVRYIL